MGGKDGMPAAGATQLWTLLQGWPVRSKVARSLQQSSMASAKVSAITPLASPMAIMSCMGHGDAGTCHAANPCRGISRHRMRTNARRMAGFYGVLADCACLAGKSPFNNP